MARWVSRWPAEDHDSDDGGLDPDDVEHYHSHDVTLPAGRALHRYSIGAWVWYWEPAAC